jgi:hypothetical protein
MEGIDNKLESFESFLHSKNVDENEVRRTLDALEGFIRFLAEEDDTVFSFPYGKMIHYADMLAAKDVKEVEYLVRGLWRYLPFIKANHHMEELLDIAESSTAMETLYERVAEWHGEAARTEIFKNINIPPLGARPETKPPVTRVILQRLEEQLGEESTKDLLRPCLHGGQFVGTDKERFHEIGDLDQFLKIKYQELLKEVEQHRDEQTAMFAQLVDDDVVNYVRNVPSMGPGVREGNRLIISKIPYQVKHFLTEKRPSMKRYYLCYCPWVRGAIKAGTEKEISPNFCYCSGGYYKLYWDEILDQSVVIEPLETALWGDMICTFAMEIPDEIMKKYVRDK